MADVFDNKEEIKKQIEKIASNQQKCILSEPSPYGTYWFGNITNPSFQQIDYRQSIHALLFTSSNRVCLLETKTDNGGL